MAVELKFGGRLPLVREKEIDMKIAQGHPHKKKSPARSLSATLEQEAHELDALHLGLRRRITAWRDAHERATARLNAMMARIDAILAQGEHTRA